MRMITEEIMRTWAEVDIQAAVKNLRYAKELTQRKIMCVIKGNAHGHGALQCGLQLEKNGADAFAVACLSEGIELRKGGIKAPILLLGWTPAEFAAQIAEYDLAQSVVDQDYALELSYATLAIGKHIDVHIKLDTGMSRTGIFAQDHPETAAQAIYDISQMPGLVIKGIFTHCAAADMPEKEDFTHWQIENHKAVLAELEKLGFTQEVVHHVGSSACIMYHKEAYFDMVRMGVMMYGLYPDGNYREYGPLSPILTLKARVAQVKRLPAGACISYGCTAKTTRPTTIAVVTAGYADAYPRAMSNKGAYAVINGQKCPQIGRICMDMCMFDVTDADVHRGDEVILYGKGGMPMEEVAALAGSINCESLCLLTNRVKRVYN